MEQTQLGEQAGLLWTWWRGDALSALPPVSRFAVTPIEAEAASATFSATEGLTEVDLTAPLPPDHNLYIASLNALPVAIGCSASGRAAFGGGRVTFEVPANNRYLYNFETLPRWRGYGIYPHLLQSIMQYEAQQSERFWIIHQSSNVSSERGIRKAGFRLACRVHFLQDGSLGLVAAGETEFAQAGSQLLGLPLFHV